MLQINPKIFKAYDIRGIYKQDFDEELAYLVGQAFVELRKKDDPSFLEKKMTVAVASDMRESSPSLTEKLIDGLTDAGADVIDLGLASTPTFYFAVGKNNCDGGVIVSASHNPREWNGFKLVRDKGKPVSGETGINFIKEKVLENNFTKADKPGSVSKIENALEEEIEFTLSKVSIEDIKKLKIVADPANSMGALYLDKLFEKIPQCELIKLNFQLDGTFPSHEADPLKEENLELLKQEVIKNKADLGISTDGDGDRIFFVDNQGEVINPAIIRGLLSKLFLQEKPNAKIGYDVRPGKITVDMINEAGGQAIMTRVGHSLIKEQMIKEDIYFAGESSGHFYLNTQFGCFEYPSIMIIKLLTEFSQIDKTVSEYVKKYETYFASGEINREVPDKLIVFRKIRENFSDGKIDELDGISVTYPNYWFNVRGSNTEEKVRLNVEARDKELVDEKVKEIMKIIEE